MVRPVWSKRLSAISTVLLVGVLMALIALPSGPLREAGAQPLDTPAMNVSVPDASALGANSPGTYQGVWPPAGTDLSRWARPAPNPDVTLSCGLDVGLLVDRSGSIERAGKALAMKDAARAVVDGMAGTPSHVGVWSFGASSAAEPGNPEYPAAVMTPVGGVDAEANVTRLDAVINAIPIGSNASTNWEAGFKSVHRASGSASQAPDLLIVLTDGRPTVHDGDLSSGSTTDVADVDAAIRAANAVKADGTRIFAFGIGGAVDASTLGLIANPLPWSGSNLVSAGYALSSFDDLADALRQATSSLCGGSLTVHKVIDDGSGHSAPGSDWVFTLDSSDDPGWAQAARTDHAGLAVFTLQNLEALRVRVSETHQPGYHLEPAEVTCQNAMGPAPDLTTTAAGVELLLGPSDVVSCTFPNRVDASPAVPPSEAATTTTSSAPVPTATDPPTTLGAPGTSGPEPQAAEPATPAEGVATPVSVAGVSTTHPAALPRTGASSLRLALGGLSLVFAGALLVSLAWPARARWRAARR